MMIESGLLAFGGAIGGIVLAFAALPVLIRELPQMSDNATILLPIVLDIAVDRRVLLFAIEISVITVLLFGLAPAWAASGASLDSVLRAARSSLRWRGRRALMIFQIALCTMLLASAGLLARTFKELHDQNPGFDRDHVVAFTVVPGVNRYTQPQAKALRVELLDRIKESRRGRRGASSDAWQRTEECVRSGRPARRGLQCEPQYRNTGVFR